MLKLWKKQSNGKNSSMNLKIGQSILWPVTVILSTQLLLSLYFPKIYSNSNEIRNESISSEDSLVTEIETGEKQPILSEQLREGAFQKSPQVNNPHKKDGKKTPGQQQRDKGKIAKVSKLFSAVRVTQHNNKNEDDISSSQEKYHYIIFPYLYKLIN